MKKEHLKYIVLILLFACVISISVWKLNNTEQQAFAYEKTVIEEVMSKPEPTKYYPVPLSNDIQDLIIRECNKYNLAPTLVLAIIAIESEYKVNAKNSVDSGLMQVNRRTYQEIAKEIGLSNDIMNVENNVKSGIYYLARLRDYWQEKDLSQEELFNRVCLSYNYGIRGATKYINRHGKSSSKYVESVLNKKIEIEMKMDGE